MDKEQVSAAPADREAWMMETERLIDVYTTAIYNNASCFGNSVTHRNREADARALLLLHLRTAAPAVQQDGWMPIESAPKKGLVDIWSDGRRFTECWRDPVCSEYRCLGNSNVLITLPLASCTHWRQPPPPPSESTGSAPAEPAPAPAMVILSEEEIDREFMRWNLPVDSATALAFHRLPHDSQFRSAFTDGLKRGIKIAAKNGAEGDR
jgi:hypothetical protein